MKAFLKEGRKTKKGGWGISPIHPLIVHSVARSHLEVKVLPIC